MKFIRNLCCLLVIFLALGIVMVNTQMVRDYLKEVLQNEVKKNTGFTLHVDDVEFDFPRSIVLHNITLSDTPEGTFTATDLTLTTPLIKLLLGDRKEIYATVDVNGVKADNPLLAQIPTSLNTSFVWKEEARILEGELFRLESTNMPFPYSLESKGTYKIIPGETESLVSVNLDRIKLPSMILDGVQGSGNWNMKQNHGKFSLLAKKVAYSFYKLSNVGIELENDPTTGQWKYEFKSDGKTINPFKVALKGLFGVVEGTPELRINDFMLTAEEDALTLKKPLCIRLEENSTYVLDEAHLRLNGKEVRISGRTDLKTVDAEVNVKDQLFSFILPGEKSPISGILTGSFFFKARWMICTQMQNLT